MTDNTPLLVDLINVLRGIALLFAIDVLMRAIALVQRLALGGTSGTIQLAVHQDDDPADWWKKGGDV